jgi:hypothetical protein
MLLENLERYKVGTTDEAVTSFAGLPLFLEMGQVLGLKKKLNQLALKERDRGYKPAEVGFSLMGLIHAGGVALDDIELLRGDEGLKQILPGIPAANTVGEFLRRFVNRTLYGLGRIVVNAAVVVIRAVGLKAVTLDIDAYTLESQKRNAEMNYKGEWGFTPVMVSCAELKMPMAGLWRGGSASPMAHLAWLLERVMRRLSGMKITVRSDSAGYQAKVVKVCEGFGADFTITARKDEAVMTSIEAIAEEAWKPYDSPAYPNRICWIAETVHAFGDEETKAHRLIAIRWRDEKEGLFKWDYHAVFTNREGAAGLVLQFHRNRQDKSENVNKEMVYGFGLEKLPCQDIKANAVYFQIAMLSGIVATAIKYLTLPESWRNCTMKTLRFKLIRLAGFVSRHARQLWLKIPMDYTYREIFEEARWRIRGLSSELAISTA